MLRAVAADYGYLFQYGFIVFTVHHQLAVAVAAGSHRTHQTVKGRRTSLTYGNPFYSRIGREPVAHLQQLVTYLVCIRSRRKETLDDKLLVVKIWKKQFFYPCHSKDANKQQAECHGYGGVSVSDEKTDGGLSL